MAAPVRYLSGRQQQQKIGIEGSTQNEKVLEVVGRVGIGTTIFEPDSELEIRGDVIVSGIITAGSIEVSSGEVSFDDVNVSGASTFTGPIDANGSLDVDGHTELDDVNVSGASTFTGAADFNGDIDVDGHTELDDLNVSGILTATTLDVTGGGGSGGQANLSNLSVSGLSTFTGTADFNGDVDIDGHTELDDVNIAGVLTATTINATTFVGDGDFVDIDVDGHTELDDVNVSGASTFTGAIDANGSLDVDGHTELDNLNVSGISTFQDGLTIKSDGLDGVVIQADPLGTKDILKLYGGDSGNGKVVIQGHGPNHNNLVANALGATELWWAGNTDKFKALETTGYGVSVFGTAETQQLKVTGVSTFTGAADFNGNVDIDGHTELDDLNVSGVSTFQSHVHLGSGDRIYFFTTDTRIYGDNNGLNIESSGTNDILIKSNSDGANNGDIILRTVEGGRIDLTGTGGVGIYHTDTAKKLETTGYGVTVTGGLNVSGISTFASAVSLNSSGTDDGVVDLASRSGTLFVRGGSVTNGKIKLQAHSPYDNIVCNAVSGTELHFAASGATGGKKLETTGIGISVSNSGLRTAYIEGPEEIWIDPAPAGAGTTSGSVRIRGDLYVDGTEFIVDVDKIELGDFNIGIASTVPTNALLDGAGLGIGAESIRKTITWNNATSALMSSENWNLASGKHYEIAGTDVLTSTTLGSGVVNSSLTSVGTLTELNVNGIATATTFDGNATSATNLAGGDTGDIPYQSAADTTTFVDASTASTGHVLIWSGSAPAWSPVSAASGNFGGITLQEEGSTVGTAGSVTGINFIGSNVTAAAGSGNVVGSVTISDTPTFDSLNVTGISTIPTISGDVTVGTGITFYASTGIISATAFYGSGENLTDIINQKIDGLQILDEGTPVGTGYSFSALNFIGNGVSVAAVGLGTTANITIEGFGSDADGNLFAGTCAGGTYNPSSGTACFNIFIGSCTGKDITIGGSNVFLGLQAGLKNTEGSCNVFLGKYAGCETTTGDDNVYIGQEAGKTGQTAHTNIAIGKMAAQSATGFQNTILGERAGRDLTGYSNVIIGQLTGVYSTGANHNVFLGAYSAQCTSGNDNVILGHQAGRHATTGCYNVFFGKCTAAGAASNNVTGNHNIAMGCEAGLCLTSGANNIFLGQEAGKKIVDGVDNVAIGQHAGCAVTSGCYNVFLGSNAGNTNTSGDCNIAIGYDVELPSATDDNQMAIGSGTNRWLTGDSSFNVTVSTASTFSSSGINVVGVVTATDFNSTSDARLKTNVQVIPNPLDKIVRIDGVSFNWIKDNKPSMGVIADNIQEVLPELVSDTDPKTVNYNGLIGLLIEVVKDQQTQINSLNERLSQLE